MAVAGVDIGSLTAKAVILVGGEIAGRSLVLTRHNSKLAGQRAFDEAGTTFDQPNYAVR